MNKGEVVKAVAALAETSETGAEHVLDAFFEVVSGALVDGESVNLRRFGKFEGRVRAPVERRNPRTGAPMSIGERRSVTFIPSENLRDLLNG